MNPIIAPARTQPVKRGLGGICEFAIRLRAPKTTPINAPWTIPLNGLTESGPWTGRRPRWTKGRR
jgi:hypothetical protein